MAEKKEVKIPEMLFFQEGPGVRNTQYTTSGVKLLNVANLVEGKVDLSTSDRYISEDVAYGKYNHFLCDEDDFIVASSGIKVDYIDKKMGFITKEMLPLCMNTSTIRFKVLDDSKLNIRYFMYFLKSNAFKKQLAKQITGSAQLNYGPSHLKQMTFPLIDIKSQNDLVKKLDYLIQIIDKKNESIRKYDDLIKARFVEMFKDEDPVFAFDDVLIDDTKNGFKLDSSNYSNLGKIAIVDQGQKRICGYINAVDGKAPWSKEAIIFGDHTEMFKYINFPFYLGADGTKLLSPKNGWNTRFLYHYLDINYHKRLGYMRHFKYLKEMSFIKPDLDRQEEFCMFCTQVDKSKFAVQKSLEKTQLLFDSLMQEYFG